MPFFGGGLSCFYEEGKKDEAVLAAAVVFADAGAYEFSPQGQIQAFTEAAEGVISLGDGGLGLLLCRGI